MREAVLTMNLAKQEGECTRKLAVGIFSHDSSFLMNFLANFVDSKGLDNLDISDKNLNF